MEAADATINNTNKKVIFKNCAPFTSCITEINNIKNGLCLRYWCSNAYL